MTWRLCFACSNLDNSMLIAQGALSQCSAVLITLGGAVALGNLEGGLELVSHHKIFITYILHIWFRMRVKQWNSAIFIYNPIINAVLMNYYHYIISWISWSIVELWYRCWCNVVVELSCNDIWPSALKQFKLHSLSAIWSCGSWWVSHPLKSS